jgi:hypothetical protein
MGQLKRRAVMAAAPSAPIVISAGPRCQSGKARVSGDISRSTCKISPKKSVLLVAGTQDGFTGQGWHSVRRPASHRARVGNHRLGHTAVGATLWSTPQSAATAIRILPKANAGHRRVISETAAGSGCPSGHVQQAANTPVCLSVVVEPNALEVPMIANSAFLAAIITLVLLLDIMGDLQ